jgi:glycosyltransferase involved in cell wall biosynthesis
MRVAVDITALHDARTGVGVVTHELLVRLAARPALDVVGYSVSWRGRRAARDLVPGLAVVDRPMAARPLRAAWRRTDHPAIERFTGAVDVVFGPNFVVPPTRGAARVALVHDLTAWRFPELCTADTLQYPALVQRAVAGGAHVVTPTRAVADEVIETTGAPAARVHPVHWAPTASPAGDPAGGHRRAGGERYVLALGTIEPRKDHVTLVRAFDRAADDEGDLRLVVAGPDGWGVEAFDAALGEARHRDRVRRLGWIDDEARADLLAGAAAFAYPSRYEGFGLPPLEAMAAGTPVVATAVPALEEVLGDAAVLVAPGDDEALAAGLRRAIGPDRHALAVAGRARAATFSWDRAADEVVEALGQAVSERAAAPS